MRALLEGARAGMGGAVVLRGEAGMGKTALLDWAVEQAAGMHVARITGVESEVELSLAGLHQLLLPFFGGVEHLPPPQRQALETIFGLVAGPAPDPFLVALAVLTLLTDAATSEPVLCVVDDAQWLDRGSTQLLAFVARRLYADRICILFALRETTDQPMPLDDLPALVVGGLADEAALDLLVRSAGSHVSEHVRRSLVAEADGNPLALIEFAAELSEDGSVSPSAPGRSLPMTRRLAEVYEGRLKALPADARTLLLVAAASEVDDPVRILRAAEYIGIEDEVAERLTAEGLVSFDGRVQFRHPLLRSATYRSASPAERRRAHEALAEAADPALDPDGRAWNLAQAATGPDEDLALELERAAARARSRNGPAAGAAFLEFAAQLTHEPARCADRLLEAAEARLHAGEVSTCRSLLARAVPELTDPLARARSVRLQGLVLQAAGQLTEATAVLAEAARMIERHDKILARHTLLDAVTSWWLSGSLGVPMATMLGEVAFDAVAADPGAKVADLLLAGFAALSARNYSQAVLLLRRAIDPLSAGGNLDEEGLKSLLAMTNAASALHAYSFHHELEYRLADDLRQLGALVALISALVAVAFNQLRHGRFEAAESTIAEGRALSKATGFGVHLGEFDCAELSLLSWRGRETEARLLADRLLRELADNGNDIGLLNVHEALAQLELGLTNYDEALRWSLGGVSSRFETAPPVNVVEAATRSGEMGTARAVIESYSGPALANGSDFDLGMLSRCRALLGGADADQQYYFSVERLQRSGVRVELARSLLLYGEWLRRQGRRRDARAQLELAIEHFDELGMQAFGRRAQAELRATGEHVQSRAPTPAPRLTPQESQIALLAAGGATNREIAAKLFVSSATVDYHLRKVFRKLGISNRIHLSQVLAERETAPKSG